MVIIPDRLTDILDKGEIQPRYYNPGDLFDEVHIVLTNDDKPDLNKLQKKIGRAKAFIYNYPENYSLPSISPFVIQKLALHKWAKPIVHLAKKINPQLIRCHGADYNLFLAYMIKKHLKIPYVTSLHINPDINSPRRFINPPYSASEKKLNRLFNYIEEKSLRAADLVMPVYKPILPYLQRVKAQNVEVCYNALNGEALSPKTNYTISDPLKIISVGRLIEDKSPEVLLRAIQDLKHVHMTIVGDGPLYPSLQETVTKLNLTDRVTFIKSMNNEQLMQSLKNYDLFAIYTQYWEINKSLLEALLTGLPCIINRRLGEAVPEFDEQFIYMVDNTADSYRKAIVDLTNNDEKRLTLGQNAFHHATKFWHPKVCEEKFVTIYKKYALEDSE